MRWAFFGGIAGLAFVGCTLLVDTGDLAGGAASGTSSSSGGTRDGSAPNGDAEGMPDARPTLDSAIKEDATPGACPPNAIICDDFESGTSGKWEPRTTVTGAIDYPAGLGHNGTRAVRFSSPAHDGGVSLVELRVPLSPPRGPGGVVYFRAYVFFATQFLAENTFSKWRTNGADDMNLKIDDKGPCSSTPDNATRGGEPGSSGATGSGPVDGAFFRSRHRLASRVSSVSRDLSALWSGSFLGREGTTRGNLFALGPNRGKSRQRAKMSPKRAQV